MRTGPEISKCDQYIGEKKHLEGRKMLCNGAEVDDRPAADDEQNEQQQRVGQRASDDHGKSFAPVVRRFPRRRYNPAAHGDGMKLGVKTKQFYLKNGFSV